MCLAAIYWAHIDKLYYAADKHDAADAGFDDSFIYKEFESAPDQRRLVMQRGLPEEAKAVFEMWKQKTDKTEY